MANGQQQEKGPWEDYVATSGGGTATEESGPWQDYKPPATTPQKSFNEQLTEVRPWPKYDPEHPMESVGRAALTGLGNYGGRVIRGVEGMAGIPHMLMHPIDTITRDIPEGAIEMGRQIGEGHPEAPLGEITGAYLTGKVVGEIPRVGEIREGIGNRIHDVETGDLTPKVEGASRAAGAAAGGAVFGSPGAITGGLAGPSLMESLFPEGAARVTKRIADAKYSELGEDLMKRGEEQARLDQAHESALGKIESGRQKELSDIERLKEQDAQSRMRRGKEQDSIDATLSSGNASPFGRIASPDAQPPVTSGSEGTAARWTNETVMELAAKGNRTAIEQAARRGIPLPENARYVMGDVDYPRTVLNPKETTKFAPTGTPVRDLARPEKSSGALLQIPKSPAVRETVPFGGPADTSAAERILDDPLATGAQKQAARHFLGMSP